MMSRIDRIRTLCAFFMAALIALTPLAALAEGAAEYDFSEMTLEELYELRDRLDDAIQAWEEAAPDDERVYEADTYAIGLDMPAGDYVIVENADALFASVIVRQSASEDAGLVMHQLINGQAVIRFAEGTWMTLTEARAYPLESAPDIDADGPVGEGGYLVGAQIAAGDYVVTPVDKAPLSSYSVYDGILGTGAQMSKFELLRQSAEVALNEGDYIELSGCTLAPAE